MSAVLLSFNPATPRYQNIAFAAGEDVPVTVSYTPQTDITSGSFTLGIFQAGTLVLTKTGGISDATAGVITFSIARADTVSLGAGAYTYRVCRTDSGNNAQGAAGQLNLLPGG